MKTTRYLLVAGVMTMFSCSIGNAQPNYSNSLAGATLIYSNSFTGSGSVNITNTTPDFSTNVLGGSNNAAWIDVGASGDNGGLFANGTVTTVNQGDTWLLPFTPQSGYVYTLSVTVNITSNPGSWITAGYAQHYANYAIGSAPPNGSINSYAWTLRNFSGNTEYFAGPAGNHNVYNATPPSPTGSYHTYTQILDTTGPQWITTAFFDGTPLGSPYNYGATAPIAALGVGQHSLSNPSGYQWTSLTLSASPLVITEQPASAGVVAGTAFTNTVAVAATSPAYQWFKDGAPIADATNASLIVNPVSPSDASTNYYVVITNYLGSITSAVASLTVYTSPVFTAAFPVTYTNVMTLYGGTNFSGTNYPGSSPTFSVSVRGQPPIYYQWTTNGVAVGGATNTSFTFTDCPLNGPTNFACVATNAEGAATNTWLASYLPAPTTLFSSTILSYNPVGFWRLNEGPDDGNGDAGVICNDYQGGNNGLYTNAYLGQAGYTNTDPTDASVRFNYYSYPYSDAYGIQGIDFSNSSNATFSVQAWVNGTPAGQPNGACILAKGYNGGEQFALDINGGNYRFLVRNAAGTASSVTATTGPDGNWHFIVGVCDEASGTVSLYVDGLIVGSASISPGSGMFSNFAPIMIGARGATPTDNGSLGFYGYLSDLAVYNQALSAGQVADLWIAAGYSIVSGFVPPLPPTNCVFLTGGTITIPATFFGPASAGTPIGYYWTNLTTGGIVGSGQTNVTGNLNATLIISNAPASLSGDQLELVVTNATSSTNWFVSLFSPPPPMTLDYSSPILYSNNFDGGTWSVDGMPLTAANALVGGTNATWHVVTNNPTDGYAAYADGTLGPKLNSVLLPFKAHSGYIYTLSASLTFMVTPPAGGWGGLGFSTQFPTNYVTDPRVLDNWGLLNMGGSGGGAVLFANKVNKGSMANLMTALNTPYAITLILDTTGSNWTIALSIDGTTVATNTYSSNPSIASFGYTQTTTTGGAFKWNDIALTQVSPSGAPPYLLDPQPQTSVTVGAGTPLSIPATGFSSFVPYGYTWSNTNTAAVLGAGTTNTVAPLLANLSVASVPSGWNGNTLALLVTNAYGTNISLVTLTVTNAMSLNRTNIMVTMTNNNLYLTWPLDHKGYTLQVQTNTLPVGLGTNWVEVPNSSLTNQVTVPIDPNQGSVFYRLFYQP